MGLEDGLESPTWSFNGFEIDGKQLEVFKNRAGLVAKDQTRDSRIGFWFSRIVETEQRLLEHSKGNFFMLQTSS